MNPYLLQQKSPRYNEVYSELQMILSKVIELDGVDRGNIQLYDDATDSLYIITHTGFDEDFLKFFNVTKPFSSPACGRAIGLGIPIVINDALTDISLKSALHVIKFRSVRSIPIFSEDGSRLGVISTHSKKTNHVWEFDQYHILIKDIAAKLKFIKDTVQAESIS